MTQTKNQKMTPEEARAKANAYIDETNEAYSRGGETADEKRLRDAKERIDRRLPILRAQRTPVAHEPPEPVSQGYDPRHEPLWLKESGIIPPPDEIEKPAIMDAHIQQHNRASQAVKDVQLVLRMAWMHRTGEQRTPNLIAPGGGPSGGVKNHVDHNAAAADYLESTFGWSELLWPVVVAMGDGCMKKGEWGNRIPTWPIATHLWRRFAPRLLRRLERLPIATYIEEREKELAYCAEDGGLRAEAARLAEIDRKYA